MSHIKTALCGVLLSALIALPAQAQAPQTTPAAAPAAKAPGGADCAKAENNDRKNLCQAKSKNEEMEYGYQNKDHSSYYCSLIRDRDLQTYCYAYTGHNRGMCDLIVDDSVTKECMDSLK